MLQTGQYGFERIVLGYLSWFSMIPCKVLSIIFYVALIKSQRNILS